LHLADPDTAYLADLSQREWRETVEFAHRGMIGLELRKAARGVLPGWVQEELEGCAARNRERMRRVREIYSEIQARLDARDIPFVALKGITQSPLFGAAPEERPQCDIDLYVPPEQAPAARDVLVDWGYEPIEGMHDFPTDHLPAMIRKTGWQWHGDYFDVDIPFAVEIHVRFWNEKLERLAAPGIENFWDRRERRRPAGVDLPALAPPDALGYASVHLLKHLLQGSVRPYHVLEIARFLDSSAGNGCFWREWAAAHAPGLRRLEAVGFQLARCWFGCGLSDAAQQEIDTLPAASQAWFKEFATSPAFGQFHPNKDELWLHLSLIDSRADAWQVARRRLFPMRIPGPVSAVCIPAGAMTLRRRASQQARRAVYAAGRIRHHALALPRVVVSGARWWLGAQFWIFLATAVLFNFALFIFVLLYNLFLLDMGYREDFIGSLSGASTIGTMAGTLPAAWLVRRRGLRGTLLGAIAAAAVVVGLRAVVRAPAALIGFAFVWGLIFSVWAVIIAPVIAGAVPEDRRPAAFSTFFAAMFTVGIAGDWIGGRLPRWILGKQAALLLAAAMVLSALLPAWRLRIAAAASGAPDAPGRIWPRSPFLKRYLAAYTLWQLATGAFNPFGNVYFARLGFSAARIGSLFSATQVTQLAAVLFSPAIIRRAGLVRAIVWMMAGTALGLCGMAAGSRSAPSATTAVLAYGWYMSLQWMSEPGLNTLLMNNVKETERGGASSLNYLVAFGAQALAAYGAGHWIAAAGYGPVLAGAAAVGLAAAAMFRLLAGSR